MTEQKPNEGWTWLSNSTKWHYFGQDGRSLCGKWFTFALAFETGMDEHPDNCKACVKKLQQRKVKTAAL